MNGISSKVAAGGVTGAITGILIWVASLFGLEIPTEVGVYIATVFAFIAGYLVPETRAVPIEESRVELMAIPDTETKAEDTYPAPQ